jgi:hypothetical protein
VGFIDLIPQLYPCRKGAVAVVTAFVLPLLFGFTSLGIEVGHWYLVQRQMQGAADAAAISASAQYIRDVIAGNTTSTTYQTTGQHYASLNGFTIPTANTCLVTSSGDDCGPVRALDARPIVCSTPPCMVVEITQDTFQWLSTKASWEPNGLGSIKSIPTPTLVARSVVAIIFDVTTTPPQGSSCILALANDRNAIQVRGNGNIHANCGLLIDGGRDQNARGPNINSAPNCSDGTAPPCGGLTLSGSNAMVHITNLTTAASTAGPTNQSCPDPTRCFLYNPSTTPLPTSAMFTNTATPDPYAGRVFTKPSGVVVTSIAVANNKSGNGYTNGTRTFTVQGGTGIPAKFTATVTSGKISSTPLLIDPGAYATLPTSPISVVADDGKGSGANVILTTGNCLPGASFAALPTPVPGRAYCSIPVTKTLNFPSGIYYAEGGDAACTGFCITTGNTNVTSAAAGVTFVLTNTSGGTTYAQFAVSGNNMISLIAPANDINSDGSSCASNCANTTGGMIVFQDRSAPTTTALSSGGGVTSSNPAAGSTLNSLSGCGNNQTCRTLSGTLYLPKQTLNFSGNGIVQGTCFGLVSKYLDDAGTPTFQNGCLPGTTGGGGSSITNGTFRLAQ